jgi:hypothetical protein
MGSDGLWPQNWGHGQISQNMYKLINLIRRFRSFKIRFFCAYALLLERCLHWFKAHHHYDILAWMLYPIFLAGTKRAAFLTQSVILMTKRSSFHSVIHCRHQLKIREFCYSFSCIYIFCSLEPTLRTDSSCLNSSFSTPQLAAHSQTTGQPIAIDDERCAGSNSDGRRGFLSFNGSLWQAQGPLNGGTKPHIIGLPWLVKEIIATVFTLSWQLQAQSRNDMSGDRKLFEVGRGQRFRMGPNYVNWGSLMYPDGIME